MRRGTTPAARSCRARMTAASIAPPGARPNAGRGDWRGCCSGLASADGDRVGTLAWNDYRHLEVYYAAPGMQAICHTVNPRLHPDDVAYIINHAADRVLFVDIGFAPLLNQIAPRIGDSVRDVVMLGTPAQMPEVTLRARHAAALLRHADGGGRRRLRLAQFRREHRQRAMLHIRNDRPAEGRAVQPPLHGAARLCDRAAGRAGAARHQPHSSRGADVPCQRLGNALCDGDDGCGADPAGAAPGRRQHGGAAEPGTRHADLRRADRVAGPVAAPAHQRRKAAHGEPHHDRRLGCAAAADRGVPRRVRRRGRARLGHDGAQPGRHLQRAEAGADRVGEGCGGASHAEAGPHPVRHRHEDRRRRGP